MLETPLDNILIILAGTKYAGNIGAVARAMHNMVLRYLWLIAPQCDINEESYRLAKGGRAILEAATAYPSLESALQGIHFLIGTTGKTGGHRTRAWTPRSLVPRILGHASQQKVGILFGPEDTGLVDDDLLRCQMLMRIPTHPNARSINLAQAVMIVCYELYLGQMRTALACAPKLARLDQTEAMYGQLEEALLKIGFLHPKNKRHMMFVLRRLLGRAGLEQSDITILRGIARQISWLAGKHSQ